MSLFHSIFLGFIQGVSEFLPISSSAHLILASWFLEGKALPLSLNVSLHLGTTLAVLCYFSRDWLAMFQALRKPSSKTPPSSDFFSMETLFKCLLIGSIPAGILGMLAKKTIEELFHNPQSTLFPLAFVDT